MSSFAMTPFGYHAVLKHIPSRPTPPFEDSAELERVWGRRWGVTDDVGRLRVVLLRRAGEELKAIDESAYVPEADALIDPDGRWYWRGRQKPDVSKLQREHDDLVDVLRGEGVTVEYVDPPRTGLTKAAFTRDTAIMTPGGAIIGRMGPSMRRGEERWVTQKLVGLGIPILRTVHGEGLFEGGSFGFLNPRTAVVGLSQRVNGEGARQVEEVLAVQGIKLLRVPLTGYSLHIDGALIMVDVDAALVNVTRLTYPFLQELEVLRIRTIEVHPDDGAYAINCLAIAPGKVVMGADGKRTADRLAQAGMRVIPVDFSEHNKNGGGIHCATLPLLRDPI